ncbi:hypothetical protein ACKKBG_A24995 [Auxenochlorella protothecoides x Auxenochlorella symbiontica]
MWLGSSASGCRPLQVDTPPRPALPADHGLNGSMHKTSSLAKLREAGHAAVYRAAGGNRELVGLWLFVLSTFFGTGMSLCAKLLARQGVPVFEVVLVRSLTLLAFTVPVLVRQKVNPFGDQRRWLYVLRGVLGFGSVSLLYYAVTLLTMADANVLAFLAPLWAALLSPLLLAEWPSSGLVVALPVSILGVLLVAQPPWLFGLSEGTVSILGLAVGITQSLFSALAKMAVRALNTNTESMAAIIFSMGAVSTLCSAIAVTVLGQWMLPRTASALALLAANGLMGYGNQVTQTAALQRAKAAPAIAMSYLSVIWGLAADVLVFHDAPDWLSLLGAVIICGCSFAVAYWERLEKQRREARERAAAVLLGDEEAVQPLLDPRPAATATA